MPAARVQVVLDYIGANVLRLRHRLGLTQEHLSERTGLDLRFVQRLERAKTNVSIATLVAIASALEVKVTALLHKASLPAPRRGRPPGKRRARVRPDLPAAGSAARRPKG